MPQFWPFLEGKVCWQYGGHAALALRFGAYLAAGEPVFDQPLFPDVYGFTSMGQRILSARRQPFSGKSAHSHSNLQWLLRFSHTRVLTWIAYLYGISCQPLQRLQIHRDDAVLVAEVAERHYIVHARKRLPLSHEESFEILLNTLLGVKGGTIRQRHPTPQRRPRQRLVFLRACHPCQGIS
jgi:hypothetical protein